MSARDKPNYHDHYARRWQWVRMVHARRMKSNAPKVVADVLALFVNRETGRAWPSQATLAEHCGIGPRQVRYSLAGLIDECLIKNHAADCCRPSYELLGFDEIDEILALLDRPKRGNGLPGSKDDPDTANKARLCHLTRSRVVGTRGKLSPNPGELSFEGRRKFASDLSTNLSTTQKLDLSEAKSLGEEDCIAENPDHLPGINYSRIAIEGEWPSGLVATGGSEFDSIAVTRIGNVARHILGYQPSDRLAGNYAEIEILARIPAPALTEMVRRTRRCTFTRRELAMALAALEIPRAS